MAEDKVIKSGQLTFPRILFLAVTGGIIVATVALGGIWLTIGYWLMTLGLCGLLWAIAMDYGVRMESVGAQPQSAQSGVIAEQPTAPEAARAAGEPRPRRRSARPAKRRR